MDSADLLPGCFACDQQAKVEAEGYTHLHVHVVPRMPDQPSDVRGPGIFARLEDDPDQWIPEAERDRIALAIRSALP